VFKVDLVQTVTFAGLVLFLGYQIRRLTSSGSLQRFSRRDWGHAEFCDLPGVQAARALALHF
jgi:hypothetical protein